MFVKNNQMLKCNKSQADHIFNKVDSLMMKKCADSLKSIHSSIKKHDEDWRDRFLEETALILQIGTAREAIKTSLSNYEDSWIKVDKKLKFQISTIFLRECQEYLISDPSQNERLHLITGSITRDGTWILSRMEKVRYEEQTPVFVKADALDIINKLASLEEDHGHFRLATFHSHIMIGINSNQPSSIDIAYQQRLAKLKSEAIGGIFTLDGFVRFFSTWKDFQIEVYGKGVQKIFDNPREKVFQILPIEK